jgi:hypothetical protein
MKKYTITYEISAFPVPVVKTTTVKASSDKEAKSKYESENPSTKVVGVHQQ